MSKYRAKPVVIDAFQFTHINVRLPEWLPRQFVISNLYPDSVYRAQIPTLDGFTQADIGDWIIRGIKGEVYPCKPDIFEATYERVEE